jgi:hypothetical protein
MRKSTLLLALLLPAAALAQGAGKPQPLPEIAPPLPEMKALDEALAPQVTIVQRGEDRVEEFRIRGRLYMMKVTPPHGVPYYLIDERGDGRMIRRDSIDERLVVPMWMIFQF